MKRAKLLAVVAVLVVAGCGGGGTESDEPQSGGTVTVGMNAETVSLDPAHCGIRYLERCLPVFGSLLRYDVESEKFVGQLAKSFEGADGRNWTLQLREGVAFSDGEPFDAEAVVFNWNRIKDPANLSPAIQLTEGMTWKVVDPLTVKVTLETPNYQLPWALTRGLGLIGSPKAIQKAGKDVASQPVGAGPFLLDSWSRNSQIDYVRNPDYFEAGLPRVDALTFKVITSDEQRLNALRSGEINVDWSLRSQDAAKAEDEGYNVDELPLVGGVGLQFNLKDPLLRDDGLRLAMLHAFDSEQLNDAVYPGDSAADAFLAPDNPYRDDDLGLFPGKDLNEAQRLFDDYLKRSGKSSEAVTFTSYAGIPDLEQAAQLIKAQLEEIDGLTLDLDLVDAATLAQSWSNRDFQMIMGNALSVDMDSLFQVFHSEGPLNVMGYSNPKVDAALGTSRTSDDPDEVADAYAVVNGELSKDAPFRHWRHQTGYLFSDTDVHDLVLTGTGSGATAYFEYAWIG